MNKYKITWSPHTKEELNKIYSYISYYLQEPNIANNLLKKILCSISSLEYFPERYLKIYNYKSKSKNLHRLLVNKYIIIYEVNNSTRTSFYSTYISRESKLFKSIIILKFILIINSKILLIV